MATRPLNTQGFIAQLLAPLPEGERIERQPFDANDWIERFRATGAELRFTSDSRLHASVDPFCSEQVRLLAEMHREPCGPADVKAALRARMKHDRIEVLLGLLCTSIRKAALGESEIERRVNSSAINWHRNDLRELNVPDNVIDFRTAAARREVRDHEDRLGDEA